MNKFMDNSYVQIECGCVTHCTLLRLCRDCTTANELEDLYWVSVYVSKKVRDKYLYFELDKNTMEELIEKIINSDKYKKSNQNIDKDMFLEIEYNKYGDDNELSCLDISLKHKNRVIWDIVVHYKEFLKIVSELKSWWKISE